MFAGNTSSGYLCAFPLMCQTSARRAGSSHRFFQPLLPSLAPFPSPSITPGHGEAPSPGRVCSRGPQPPKKTLGSCQSNTPQPHLISSPSFLPFFLRDSPCCGHRSLPPLPEEPATGTVAGELWLQSPARPSTTDKHHYSIINT